MYLNIFKYLIIFCFLSTVAFGNETISFLVPDGWGLNNSSQTNQSLIFTPKFQELNSAREILEISSIENNNKPIKIVKNNLLKTKEAYSDFNFYMTEKNYNSAMGLGCSIKGAFCKVVRGVQGKNSLILLDYTNLMPHYSQGFFQKWTNILSQITVLRGEEKEIQGEVFSL